MDNVYFIQYATKQVQTCPEICVLVSHLTSICPSLFECTENTSLGELADNIQGLARFKSLPRCLQKHNVSKKHEWLRHSHHSSFSARVSPIGVKVIWSLAKRPLEIGSSTYSSQPQGNAIHPLLLFLHAKYISNPKIIYVLFSDPISSRDLL